MTGVGACVGVLSPDMCFSDSLLSDQRLVPPQVHTRQFASLPLSCTTVHTVQVLVCDLLTSYNLGLCALPV